MPFIIFIVAALSCWIAIRLSLNHYHNRNKIALASVVKLNADVQRLKKEISDLSTNKNRLEVAVSTLSAREKRLTNEIMRQERVVKEESKTKLNALAAEIERQKKTATDKLLLWAENEERRIDLKLRKQAQTK